MAAMGFCWLLHTTLDRQSQPTPPPASSGLPERAGRLYCQGLQSAFVWVNAIVQVSAFIVHVGSGSQKTQKSPAELRAIIGIIQLDEFGYARCTYNTEQTTSQQLVIYTCRFS